MCHSMRLTFLVVLGAIVLSLAATGRADVLNVPDEYFTIQQAIQSANDGDVVRVAPGTYGERLDFLGKDIAVLAVEGPEVTFLDGASSWPVVVFCGGERSTAILAGFTIQNGRPGFQRPAGGINCIDASPTIAGNRIVRNAGWAGAGIHCTGSASPLIDDNIFLSNNGGPSGSGGAIHCTGNAAPVIRGNTFQGNLAGFGGAIAVVSGARAVIDDNVISGNTSYAGARGVHIESASEVVFRGNRVREGGVRRALVISGCPRLRLESNLFLPPLNPTSLGSFELVDSPDAIVIGNAFLLDLSGATNLIRSSPRAALVNNTFLDARMEIEFCDVTAVNTIFWHRDHAPVVLGAQGSLSATHCLIRGGWPGVGNIDAHPLCIGGLEGDPRLRIESPCVDAGTLAAPELLDFDLDGQPRQLPGRPGVEPRIDIGADEMALEHAVRFGQIGAADPDRPLGVVLHVSGRAGGDDLREVHLGPDDWLEVRLIAPVLGPELAPYVLYAFDGEPTVDTISRQPGGLGWMAFGTPLSGDAPGALDCIWNNIGSPGRLGQPHRPSEPAPHLLFRIRPENLPPGLVLTLQGFMFDDRSTAIAPASVTNAVVVRVE